MEPPPEPLSIFLELLYLPNGLSIGLLLGIMVLLLLLVCSALISGAEVSYFSLTQAQTEEMSESGIRIRKLASELLERPKRLLATILIANNFVNVGIVILSTFLISKNIPAEKLNYLLGGIIPVGRVIEIFGITLIVLLFGEILPKIYANQNAIKFSSFMSFPLYFMASLLAFISIPLIKLTSLIDKIATDSGSQLSVDDLSHALELTKAETPREQEDRKILEGIVKFGNTDVKQIMKPRTDVEAIERSTGYIDLLTCILDSGFSRVPIYENSLDKILGIIHIKDLLPHINESDDFEWQKLMREAFFVPESKMIDDLLEEFREKKMHLAIVVDEYGGCEGLVTLEDIIEEIVGDISDEFDDEDVVYSKLDENNYVFEGKTNLKEFYRVMQIEGSRFEKHKGEADTLAGFILEQVGKMPVKNQRVSFGSFEFTVESVDKRRIKRVKANKKKKSTPSVGSGTPLLIVALLSFGLISCNQDFTPKPRGFMHIELPQKEYIPVATECPFGFETATYSTFLPDERALETCWFNIEYPQFKAKLHFSYKPLNNDLGEYLEQARTLTNKHLSKATALDETLVIRENERVFGMVYSVGGSEAASPLQFYLTDSTNHFLRGALYFSVSPNNDSLAPVIDFLREDVLHLIETLNWK